MTTDLDLEGLRDLKIGELNNIEFDPGDPLVTNDYNGKSLLSNMMSAFLARDSVFNESRPHKGVVLLSAKVQTVGIPGLAGVLGKAASFVGINKSRNFAIIRVPEIHGHMPSPDMAALLKVSEDYEKNGTSNYADISNQDKLLLSMHDSYFSAPINSGDMPALHPGDVVLLDGDGLIIQLVETSEVGFFGRLKGSVLSALDWSGGGVLGALAEEAINAEESGTIYGEDIDRVTSVVEIEAARWNGKKANHPDVQPYLDAYWDATKTSLTTPPHPWSAAFISYVLKESGSNLFGSAHWKYVEAASEGVDGYSLIEANNTDKIQANLGDILVRDRSTTRNDYYTTHGDIVWKIENGVVYLAGGNLSSTVDKNTRQGRVTVDESGFYTSFDE